MACEMTASVGEASGSCSVGERDELRRLELVLRRQATVLGRLTKCICRQAQSVGGLDK